MAKAKTLKGSRVRQWDESKIRRGARGRFAEKPDAIGFTEARARLPKGFKAKIRTSQELKEALKLSDAYKDRNSKAELLSQLTPEQKTRLREILERRRANNAPEKPAPKTPEANTSKASTTPKTLTTDTDRPKLTKSTDKRVLKDYARTGDLSLLSASELSVLPSIKAPTPRTPGKPDDINIGDVGKITLWDTKKTEKYGKPDPDFKVRTNKKHEYKITTDDGTELTLNRHTKTIKYKGETVEGVPSLAPRLTSMKDEELFNKLITTKGYVESSEAPPAPKWLNVHGTVDKKYLANAGYGSMEIHHVNQWARTRFDEITKEYDSGKITLDEAKSRMRQLLVANPKEKIGYHINIQDEQDRRFVILAAGTHNVTSPLYFVNHPKGIHPDTGKLEVFGIPKDGAGGRSEFNKFRDSFWREVYKKETYALLSEVNRRVNKGLLSRERARELIKKSYEQGVKNYNSSVKYKEWVETRKDEIKSAKIAAGLDPSSKKKKKAEVNQ